MAHISEHPQYNTRQPWWEAAIAAAVKFYRLDPAKAETWWAHAHWKAKEFWRGVALGRMEAPTEIIRPSLYAATRRGFEVELA